MKRDYPFASMKIDWILLLLFGALPEAILNVLGMNLRNRGYIGRLIERIEHALRTKDYTYVPANADSRDRLPTKQQQSTSNLVKYALTGLVAAQAGLRGAAAAGSTAYYGQPPGGYDPTVTSQYYQQPYYGAPPYYQNQTVYDPSNSPPQPQPQYQQQQQSFAYYGQGEYHPPAQQQNQPYGQTYPTPNNPPTSYPVNPAQKTNFLPITASNPLPAYPQIISNPNPIPPPLSTANAGRVQSLRGYQPPNTPPLSTATAVRAQSLRGNQPTAKSVNSQSHYNDPIVAAFRKAEVDTLNDFRRDVWKREPADILGLLRLGQVNELPKLCLNEPLSREAQRYADTMAAAKQSGHTVGGTTPDTRYKDHRSFIGENVAEVDEAQVEGGRSRPDLLAQANSRKSSGLLREDRGFPEKGHYVNMVNPAAKSVGIGVWWATKPDGFTYWYSVQLFSDSDECNGGRPPEMFRRQR